MSRRRLYLMRHAEVSYFLSDGSPVNPTEVPLNADGVAQAHAVAEAFRNIDLDRVVTSGLPRTLETAAFVAPGVEPESWPELREKTARTTGGVVRRTRKGGRPRLAVARLLLRPPMPKEA